MALRYVNPRAATNGDGLSWATAWNTFAGITWGANAYMVGGGTLFETIAMNSSGASVVGLDPDDMPVIDCENTRAIGINFNAQSNCSVGNVRVTNQNAAPANGGIKLSGTGNTIYGVALDNCQVGIHGTNCPGAVIRDVSVDVGNALTLTAGYGIRIINVVSGAAPLVTDVRLSTSLPMEYAGGIGFEASDRGTITKIVSSMRYVSDHIFGRLDASGVSVTNSLLVGTGDIISLESAHSWTVRNNTIIHLGTLAGHFGPCVKLGDTFGAGTASDNNSILNNALVSLGSGNKIITFNPAGVNNIVNGNQMYGPALETLVTYDVGGGLSALTYAQFEALGYQAAGAYGDPEIGADYRQLIGSPLLSGGLHIGYTTDLDGRQRNNPPSIGAYEGPVVRSAASAREPRV